MKSIALAGLVLAAVSVPAAAQDWRALDYVGEGRDAAIVYFDVASVKTLTPTTREMATGSVYENVRTLPSGVTYHMNRNVYRVDCTAMTLVVLRTDVFGLASSPLFSVPGKGAVLRIVNGSTLAPAARAACGGDFSAFKHRSGSDAVISAGPRFRARAAAKASLASTNWHRLAVGGTAPQRMAYFVDKSSIVTEFNGEKSVTTMLVIETPADRIKRTVNRVRVDCATQTWTQVHSELFGADHVSIGGFLASDVAKINPGLLLGRLSPPVCAGNWSSGRAFPQAPQAIVATAFAP